MPDFYSCLRAPCPPLRNGYPVIDRFVVLAVGFLAAALIIAVSTSYAVISLIVVAEARRMARRVDYEPNSPAARDICWMMAAVQSEQVTLRAGQTVSTEVVSTGL